MTISDLSVQGQAGAQAFAGNPNVRQFVEEVVQALNAEVQQKMVSRALVANSSMKELLVLAGHVQGRNNMMDVLRALADNQ